MHKSKFKVGDKVKVVEFRPVVWTIDQIIFPDDPIYLHNIYFPLDPMYILIRNGTTLTAHERRLKFSTISYMKKVKHEQKIA